MAEKKELLEAYIRDAGERGFFNGSWLLAQGGRVVSQGALGIAHPYRKTPLDLNSVFELASVSKHFTATAVMILRDRGMVSLDDPLTRFFPGSPYHKGITLRHMMNHTAGLPDYTGWLTAKGNADGKIYPNTIMETFLLESGLPALFEPGEQWSYSNTAYALLALIVQRVSGMNYADFMRQEIFEPCGMARSCVYHRRMNGETIENYAYGMVMDGGEYKLPDDVPDQRYVIPMDGIEGDGIVNSTVGDMFLWDKALREATVLSLASQEEMYTPARLNSGESYPYGFGWQLSEEEGIGRVVQHGGGWPGYRTHFLRLPDSVFVYMLNQSGCDAVAHNMLHQGLCDIALGRAAVRPQPLEEMRVELPRAEAEALCGDYTEGGSVTLKDGRLHVRLCVAGFWVEGELVPVGNNVFYQDSYGYEFKWDKKSLIHQRFGVFDKL